EEALKSDSPGFDLEERAVPRGAVTGSHIILDLKNPTERLLEAYHRVLANLPDDSGKCRYYTGKYPLVKREVGAALKDFGRLRSVARQTAQRRMIARVDPSSDPDLKGCQIFDF